METYPNVYYNYRKHRRAKEVARKQDILHQIQTIYHETNDVAGYRRMRIYLARNGIELSTLTVHKYMNTELGLRSIVRRKAPKFPWLLQPVQPVLSFAALHCAEKSPEISRRYAA